MDEIDEILSSESQPANTTADIENAPVIESISTTDDPEVRLHSSPPANVNLSGAEDGKFNQECINDTSETYFSNDSVTDDLQNETLLENDAEMHEVRDRAINANDSLTTSHLTDSIRNKPSGAENECIKDIAETYINDSVSDDLPNETLLENDAEMNEVPDETPNTNDSLITSDLTDSITETNTETKSDQKTEKISQFPLGRVRDIMKSDPDIKIVSAECVFLVAKATEMFLQKLGTEIHTITLRNKKKTLQKKDLDAVISENIAFEFLDGALN